MSLLELKNILEGCNFYREGYHANDRMKGNKAVGDTSIVCVHKLAWNLLGAANCRMGLPPRGKKVQVRFKRNSSTGRTDERRAGPKGGLGNVSLRLIPISC